LSPSPAQGSSMNRAGRIPMFPHCVCATPEIPSACAARCPQGRSDIALSHPIRARRLAFGFYAKPAEQKPRKERVLNTEYQTINWNGLTLEITLQQDRVASRIGAYLEDCDGWTEYQKRHIILAVGEAGYRFDLGKDDPNSLGVDIYEIDSLKDLAEHFVEEGLFGEIPASIRNYLDYDLIARDLGMDYSEATIAGTRLVYRHN